MSARALRFLEENNLYQLLEIENFSTSDRVKEGYRSLAMRCHPDRVPECSLSAGKFILGAKAYRVLSDKDQKVLYDRLLKSRLKKEVSFKNREFLRQRKNGVRTSYSQSYMVDPDYNRFIDECRGNFQIFLKNVGRIKVRPALFHPASLEPSEYEAYIEEGRKGFDQFLESLPRVERY